MTRRPREGGGRWRPIPAPLRKATAAPAFAGATAIIGRKPSFPCHQPNSACDPKRTSCKVSSSGLR